MSEDGRKARTRCQEGEQHRHGRGGGERQRSNSQTSIKSEPVPIDESKYARRRTSASAIVCVGFVRLGVDGTWVFGARASRFAASSFLCASQGTLRSPLPARKLVVHTSLEQCSCSTVVHGYCAEVKEKKKKKGRSKSATLCVVSLLCELQANPSLPPSYSSASSAPLPDRFLSPVNSSGVSSVGSS